MLKDGKELYDREEQKMYKILEEGREKRSITIDRERQARGLGVVRLSKSETFTLLMVCKGFD